MREAVRPVEIFKLNVPTSKIIFMYTVYIINNMIHNKCIDYQKF